jgi:hypothetical protein
MAKKFTVDILSPSSIDKLKKELTKYRNSLQGKCRILVERLSAQGLTIAEAKVNESPLGSYITLRVETNEIPSGAESSIIGVGVTKQAEGYEDFNILLAVEFGAGIHHNATANPYSGQLGFGVGTFPGQTHAFEDSWWYWDANDEKWKRTHGVKATMPMYNAFIGIKKIIATTAREVFSNE